MNLGADNSTLDTSGYSGLDPQDVAAATQDDASAGFLVSSVSGSATEEGGQALFTVRLTSRPTSDSVVVSVTSDNTSEASVTPSTLTFSAANWRSEQEVRVTGVDDNVSDGNSAFRIVLDNHSSTAAVEYLGLNPPDVMLSNIDDETPGFLVSSISGNLIEKGGTATFTVKMTSQPTSVVNIPLSVSDTSEATVSGDNSTHLMFTTSNWNADHVVTLTSVDDNESDGTQSFLSLIHI